MVKSVLGVSHLGLRDWLIQRLTALYLTFYTIGLVVFLIKHADISFYEWQGLFENNWVKVATLIGILCLLLHAWVGMWTVLTDYVKPFAIRFILYVLILLSLFVFFFQTVLILWGL